jgi:ATP-dependent Lhr-like helicase
VVRRRHGVPFPRERRAADVELFLPAPDDVEDLVVHLAGDLAVRGALSRERGARAAACPTRAGQACAAVGAAQAARICWRGRRVSAASRSSSRPTASACATCSTCRPRRSAAPGRSREDPRAWSTRPRRRPFAASLLFSYVASFIYEGDAPLAERRAQALSVDQAQLRELLGEAELRELLELDAIESVERQLQHLERERHVRHADALHDLFLSLGELSRDGIIARTDEAQRSHVDGWLAALAKERRIIEVTIAGERRFAAAEDAGKLRDALGLVPPVGLPSAFLEPTRDALARGRRALRTHPRSLPRRVRRRALRPRHRACAHGPRAARRGGPRRRG